MMLNPINNFPTTAMFEDKRSSQNLDRSSTRTAEKKLINVQIFYTAITVLTESQLCLHKLKLYTEYLMK